MRQLKFRYVYRNIDTSELKIVIKDITQIEKDNEPYLDGWVLISRDEFTGLTDKNGKEIYEGDVVLFTWFSYGEYELETEYQGSIDFLNGSFLFCCEHGNYPLSELEFDSESDIEVIGNIHDNPELLT